MLRRSSQRAPRQKTSKRWAGGGAEHICYICAARRRRRSGCSHACAAHKLQRLKRSMTTTLSTTTCNALAFIVIHLRIPHSYYHDHPTYLTHSLGDATVEEPSVGRAHRARTYPPYRMRMYEFGFTTDTLRALSCPKWVRSRDGSVSS